MAIDDPKTRVKTPEPEAVTQSDFLSAMKLLLEQVKGSDDPTAKERVALEAERLLLERERVAREMPENRQSPGISVYSYPEGDLKRPKPPLKCKTFWCGREETMETLTPMEIEWLNKLEPGTYKVTKTDGGRIDFKVRVKRADSGALEEMAIVFPCNGEHRHNHGSKVSYCRQAMGEYIPSVDELMVELARLKEELASARTGIAAA